MEVCWSFGGEVHDFSKFVTEIEVFHGSESIKGLGKLVSDGNLVENDVIFDDGHVLLWALNDINDIVEVRPVHRFLINGFANWDGLLELLDECNNSNDSSDSFLWIFVFKWFFKDVNGFVKDKSWLIGNVNAFQKIGEVESTNFGWFEETLGNLGDHLSVLDILNILFNW